MSVRRVKILNAALCILQEEQNNLFQWTALEMMPNPSPEAVSALENLYDEGLLRGFDEALMIYIEARNSLCEERKLKVPELTLEFSTDTFSERG